jgi:Protein of unknown function (DUF3365)
MLKFHKRIIALAALALSFVAAVPSQAANDQSLAVDLVAFLRAGQSVIAANQAKINDPALGDKGLTPAFVLEQTKAAYKEKTGRDIDEKDPFIKIEIRAILDVMNDAQPVINEKGKAFKGFIPAVFATHVTQKFNADPAAQGKISLKMTAPAEIVRNRKNRPDEWESKVIEAHFKSPAYDKTTPYSETTDMNGEQVYRYIIPVYYGENCMSCHGMPKGEIDITGSKKEGLKVGDLGGAFSVSIPKPKKADVKQTPGP